ncbi:MAG: isoprenyl transferase [Candidatus Omnitrophica bacterium]|nr:isoprenyl transferase [Candidatus Omnitrophota bacterium]
MNNIGTYPEHVAIIMDGNGRWARERGLERTEGHKEGIKSVDEAIKSAIEFNVKTLVLYAFSTENWKRPKSEIAVLMSYLSRYLDEELERLKSEDIKFTAIGRLNDLSKDIIKKIERNMEETKKNSRLHLVLALSYGGRNEIIDAVKGISSDVVQGKVVPAEIDDSFFKKYLYCPDMHDPDLLIRTSGEMRISNFLLWQISYSELYVTDAYWPDFRKEHFRAACETYKARERRFGK